MTDDNIEDPKAWKRKSTFQNKALSHENKQIRYWREKNKQEQQQQGVPGREQEIGQI